MNFKNCVLRPNQKSFMDFSPLSGYNIHKNDVIPSEGVVLFDRSSYVETIVSIQKNV